MKKIISLLLAALMTLGISVNGFAAKRPEAEMLHKASPDGYSMIWHRAMNDFGDWLGNAGGRNRTVFIDLKAGADGSALRFQFNNLAPEEGELKAMTVFVNGRCFPVTYHGDTEIRVPANEVAYSDPVKVNVKRNDSIQIRIFYHKIRVGFWVCRDDGPFTKKGNQTRTEYPNGISRSRVEKDLSTLTLIPLLSAVEVCAKPIQSIVVFGDSIVAQDRWVSHLAQRVSDYYGGRYAVLNSGIGGNCLSYRPSGALGQFFGEKGTDRFQRDVLELTNVHTAILSLGVNDIGDMTESNQTELNVQKLIADTTSLVQQLRSRGIRIVAQTITPRMGYEDFNQQQEQYRQEYNSWLRHCGLFDYLIDFDACVRDPEHPEQFRDGLHLDHLHPNDKGGAVMADYVKLDQLV